MKLTAQNVETVLNDCLFREGEDTSAKLIGHGCIRDFGFHPDRLAKRREDVKSMLSELPESFQQSKGGGWSFLNACQTRDGEQWGEHCHIEQLLALGTALSLAKILLPKEMWPALPGGMPYFSVNTEG